MPMLLCIAAAALAAARDDVIIVHDALDMLAMNPRSRNDATAHAHLVIGVHMMQSDRPEAALVAVRAAATASPNPWYAWAIAAEVLRDHLNRPSEAVELMGRAAVAAPDPDLAAELRFKLGSMLANANSRFDESVAHLKAAVAHMPGHAHARTNLGATLSFYLHRHEEAASVYREGLGVAPEKETNWWTLLVSALTKARRADAAAAELRAAAVDARAPASSVDRWRRRELVART